MAKKKARSKRASAGKKKSVAKGRPRPRPKAKRVRKTAVRKAPARKKAGKKTKRVPAARRSVDRARSRVGTLSTTRGLGLEAGGQSGDTEGISRAEIADSESVEELLEEGQAFEAGVISGVENAPDADKGGVRTRQVPEDDVPQEYLDED